MTDARFDRITQAPTVFSVIVGVVLVVRELRQTRELLRYELGEMNNATMYQTEPSVLGDDFAETLARVRLEPEKVTAADLVRFDAYVFTLVNGWQHQRFLYETGFDPMHWQELTDRNDTCRCFGHAVGRAWLGSTACTEGDPVSERLRSFASDCDGEGDYLRVMRRRIDAELSGAGEATATTP